MSQNIEPSSSLVRWHKAFRALFVVLISTGLGALACITARHVDGGTFAWWPYIAFTLMIIVIFFVVERAFARAGSY